MDTRLKNERRENNKEDFEYESKRKRPTGRQDGSNKLGKKVGEP
jgi:hypothetical protein